jgi:predicted 3-demethylubiquinone-9 3-methyltransferase (glyoxalase superfamily)
MTTTINNAQKITPCLWFDNKAEEAVNFYSSLFKDTKILEVSHYGENAPLPAGTVLTISFLLEGQEFMALNGGPMFKFSPAVSFVISCENQEEIDHFWDKLSEGGEKQNCGWLQDKYGLSWQVVPAILPVLFKDKDKAKSQRVMDALLKMYKLDIAALMKAFDGN